VDSAGAALDDAPKDLADALSQLAEARATLRAIGAGEVDAFLISDGAEGHRVFALSTADRPYRMFVERMQDGAATVASDGLILFANDRLAQLLARPKAEVIGTELARFIVGTAAAEWRQLGRSGATYELELLDANGTFVPVLVGAAPLVVDDEHLTCLTFTDLTAQRELERIAERTGRQLAAAEHAAELDALGREEANRANQAKNEFLSRMSHELRTPLNAVLGFAQILQLDDLTTDQDDSVHQIHRAGEHLLDLINDVLDISRIEAGGLRLSLEPVNVADVVASALSLIRPQAAARDISVPADADIPGDVYVHSDRQRLLQVLLNVLSNAVKYNRPGGSIELLCETSGRTVSISVTDSGAGISEANLRRLFTPFERLGAEASATEGTGVGLALSRSLSEQMHGTLTATSIVGTGSTFTLELPEDQPLDAYPIVHPVRSIRREAPPNVVTVLAIEDSVANIRLMERIIEQCDNVVLLTAIQGRLGLELAAEHHPDLVLLDLDLPDLPGVVVMDELRSDPVTASIPVVICSGDASASQRRMCLERGAAAYFTKPFLVADLLELIEQVRRGEAPARGSDPLVRAP
jgi:signal transduction histidine kinase/CheY-like chemotaxis protein